MSVATTSLADSLSSSVLKLDTSGTNWVVFSVRFCNTVEAKGFWGHFDGMNIRLKQVYGSGMITPSGTVPTIPTITTADLAASQKIWNKNKMSAKSLLTQKVPNSTFMCIHNKKTICEKWAAIKTKYNEKGTYAQTDLQQKFMDSKCLDQGNIQEFPDGLCVKQEELASVGVDIQ